MQSEVHFVDESGRPFGKGGLLFTDEVIKKKITKPEGSPLLPFSMSPQSQASGSTFSFEKLDKGLSSVFSTREAGTEDSLQTYTNDSEGQLSHLETDSTPANLGLAASPNSPIPPRAKMLRVASPSASFDETSKGKPAPLLPSLALPFASRSGSSSKASSSSKLEAEALLPIAALERSSAALPIASRQTSNPKGMPLLPPTALHSLSSRSSAANSPPSHFESSDAEAELSGSSDALEPISTPRTKGARTSTHLSPVVESPERLQTHVQPVDSSNLRPPLKTDECFRQEEGELYDCRFKMSSCSKAPWIRDVVQMETTPFSVTMNSRVFKGILHESGSKAKRVAVKEIILKDEMRKENELTASILFGGEEGVIRTEAAFQFWDLGCLVQEYVGGGDLSDWYSNKVDEGYVRAGAERWTQEDMSGRPLTEERKAEIEERSGFEGFSPYSKELEKKRRDDPFSLEFGVFAVTALTSEAVIQLVAFQLLRSVSVIHAASYVHKDLKLENVMVKAFDADGNPSHLAIIDFDLSEKVEGAFLEFDGIWSKGNVPIWYLPGRSYPSYERDLWAVGNIVWHLFAGPVHPMVDVLLDSPDAFQWPRHASSNARDFLTCIYRMQERRKDPLTAEELLGHPWLLDVTLPPPLSDETAAVIAEESSSSFRLSRLIPRVRDISLPSMAGSVVRGVKGAFRRFG